MFKEIIGNIWKKTPYRIRSKIIRTTQNTFTASAGVFITNSRKEILLLDHVLRPRGGWGVPGGFMNYNEQPEQAVEREVMEEVGLKISNIKFLHARTVGRHIEFVFSAECDGEPKVLSREIRSAAWFAVDNLPAELSPGYKIFVEEYFKTIL